MSRDRTAMPGADRNPFSGDVARAASSYAGVRAGRLVRLGPEEGALPVEAERIHEAFRAFLLGAEFSCLGGRAAVQRGTYRMGFYARLGSAEATAGLARDLYWYTRELDTMEKGFTTFVATFAGPAILSERAFERLLWAQLQRLHDVDRAHHGWAPAVSADPEDDRFSFSFAEQPFFVVGLHAGSCRWTRRFAWPALVFNPHAQFERLREQGQYGRLRALIREREYAIQGTINPMLSDFGERSEARQYSGRPTEEGWRCPFSARPKPVGESREDAAGGNARTAGGLPAE